jgi:hypothetical protein
MRMPVTAASPSLSAVPRRLSRQCEACEAEEKQLRRAAVGATAAELGEAPASVHQALRSPGQPLDPSTRAFFEPRFDSDLGEVRVHDDANAARSAAALDARAFAYGRDIVFARDEYAPWSSVGKGLLAHELAHVVQHTGLTGTPHRIARAPKPDKLSGAALKSENANVVKTKMLALYENLSDEDRLSLDRYTTIAIGLIEDTDRNPRLVYTVASNRDRPGIRAAADKIGITLWTPRGRAEGRGGAVGGGPLPKPTEGRLPLGIGAPNDAEQLLIAGAEQNDAILHAIATSRPVCPDCGPAVEDYGEHVALVHVPDPKIPALRAAAARGGGTRLPPAGGASPRATGTAAGEPEQAIPAASPSPAAKGTEPETQPTGAEVAPKIGGRSPVIEMGASFAADVIIGLLLDYIASKIGAFFDRRDFAKLLRELQPQIDAREREVYQSSPPELQHLINTRQCYWIIQLRFGVRTTTWVGGGRGGTVHSNSLNLESVEISDSPTGGEGPLQQGRPIVAPARHAVIMMDSSRVVTYSVPIVSWHAEIPGLEHGLPKFGTPQPEAVDRLRFAATGRPVTEDSLLAWARENMRRGLDIRTLLRNIYASHEFMGSQDARERAAEALVLRLREERAAGR